MPALKMKAKASTTCIKEVSCLHVTQKSRKISKDSSSLVRLCSGTAELGAPFQDCNSGSSKDELSATKNGSNEASDCKTCHDGEYPAFQKWFSAEDPITVNKMDAPPPACPTNFDAICSPVMDDYGIYFESIARENDGCDDGPVVPDTKADDYDNWISESSGCQTPDVLDYYISDMNVSVINGISGFDVILNDNLFTKSGYLGKNLVLDMAEESMKLPALEEKAEMVDMHFAGSCEELAKNSDYSHTHLMSHQINAYNEGADVNSCNNDLDEVDFDPQLFIRNLLDLSDMEPDLLPAIVPKETSERKRVTLVLDLDETLVHSTTEPCDDADFTFRVFFNMKEHTVYVRQRPFLQTFLERVAEMFEIIVFTASESVYAEKLLDILDPDRKLIARRAYRESCIFSDGSYAKDLTVLGVDLAKIAIIDNSPQVALLYEDGRPVDGKGIGRKILDKVQETYGHEFKGKYFAYDGEKSLFTLGALERKKLEFTVVLEDLSSNRIAQNDRPGGDGSPNESDRKRMKRPYRSKVIRVEISYAAKIPMQAIANALRGRESEHFEEAMRVLDIILRQIAANQGCLLVRQSFFHNNPRNLSDLGGGVVGLRGFHSSFRATQHGLSLNMDVSTTMIVKPGPVMDFLLTNQNLREPSQIDWNKAKRMLKNLRIKTNHSNTEFKITGLSDYPCIRQMFPLKQKSGHDGDNDDMEISVYEYFVNHRHIKLQYSANFPCINVGKPKRPTYIPLELCTLVSLQRYTKALSNQQRASLVEKSRQKPQERMRVLTDGMRSNNYGADPLLHSFGVSIGSQFTQVEGRVLPAPRLKVGNGEDFFPRGGRWNFNNKKLVDPVKIERWAIVNFSARCDICSLCSNLIRCGQMKGILINNPYDVFEERPQYRREPAPTRVDKMFDTIKSMLPGPPQFLLCILPERKNSDIYGPWKRKILADNGIVTQCIAPTKVNDQYLTNVLLKINAKLGGMNSLLTIEHSCSIPFVSKPVTMILGMDVSHGSPGHSDMPSIAAVVSSRQWPSISRYRASVRTQSPKVEMIANLFKPGSGTDSGIIRELLADFYSTSGQRKPENIIIFRDGVSESQFNQVLNIELDQIIEACKFLDEKWSPKFIVIVAQKNHHTKFFQSGDIADNVPPGTVIDNRVCHPRNNDFYLCAHAGMIGTSRPTHYHVLHDEIGFSIDDLQELVHSLSYVYQRSTTAVSVVAPICYAHLAAAQMSQFIKFDEMSDTSSSHAGITSAGSIPIPELPILHKDVCNSMFFC